MANLGKLNIELGIDNTKFLQGITRSETELSQFAKKAQRDTNQIALSVNRLEKSMGFLAGGFITAGSLLMLSKQADTYTELNNRMRLVTSSAVEQHQAFDAVYQISLATNQSMGSTAQVYQRFAQNANALGISQAKVADLTEIVSKAVAVSGASTQAADAALTQFGQALSSGVFRGEEFNSVMEQTPGLAQAIAKGMGVAVGQLRAMANNGELTADVLIKALTNAKESVNEQFNTRVVTLSQSFVNLNSAATKWVGEQNTALGITSKLGLAVEVLANNFGDVVTVLGTAGLGIASAKMAGFTKTTIAQTLASKAQAQQEIRAITTRKAQIATEIAYQRTIIKSMSAQLQLAQTETERASIRTALAAQTRNIITLTNQETAATTALATAKRSASLMSSGLSGAVSFLGGPVGIATGLITAGAMALYSWHEKAEQAKKDALEFAKSIDITSESLKAMTDIALNSNQAKLKQALKAQRDEVRALQEEYDALIKKSQKKIVLSKYTAGREIVIDNSSLSQDAADKAAIILDKLNAAKQLEKQITDNLNLSRKEEVSRLHEAGIYALEYTKYLDGATSGGFASKVSDLSNQFSSLQGFIGGASTELQAFNAQMLVVRTDKIAASISESERLLERAKLSGKDLAVFDAKNTLKGKGIRSNDLGYEEALNKLTEVNMLKISKTNTKKRASGPDYVKQYTTQLTNLQNKLADLEATSKDMQLFGRKSQYQELSKLTADIANNGKKYAHYGVDGLAKLKQLASEIDSQSQQNAIRQFSFSKGQELDNSRFDLSMTGKTNDEQEQARYNRELDLQTQQMKVGMTKENVQALDREVAKLKEVKAELIAQQNIIKSDPYAGLLDGIQQYGEQATNVFTNVSDITQSAFNGMSNALTDLVTTGKADFRGMAVSILSDISQMMIKMALFNAIKAGASAMGYSDGGLVGYATGGYTGSGGKYEPAGIVHRGEYVITKEATSKLGVGFLNSLNYGLTPKGYANGGIVGNVNMPSFNGGSQNNVTIAITMNNDGASSDNARSDTEKGKQLGQLIKTTVLATLQEQKRAGGLLAQI